jgi:hypothetical protein
MYFSAHTADMPKRRGQRRGGAEERSDPAAQFTAAMDQHQRDIDLALKRLGETAHDRARWILDDFVVRDPDQLSSGERLTLRQNLEALARTRSGEFSHSWRLDDPLWTSDAALREFWERARALAEAHRRPVTLPDAPEMFQRRSLGGPYVRLARIRRPDDAATAVLYAVADNLAECDRLRECLRCHRLFVANRRQLRHEVCARQTRDEKRPGRGKRKGKTNG